MATPMKLMYEHGLEMQYKGERISVVLDDILHELHEAGFEWVARKRLEAVAAAADLEEPLAVRTVHNLLSDLAHFGVLSPKFNGKHRVTVLGRCWLERWFKDGKVDVGL